MRLRDMKSSAKKAATWRGHSLTPFLPSQSVRHSHSAVCRTCGASVTVVAHPSPNDIGISGEAVALNCSK